MQYFPLFVDTQKLTILIVGAGEVATRKIDLLARSEASIDVIAPDIAPEIQQYADKGRVTVSQREISEGDIHQYDLIYLATANNELNKQLSILAQQRGIWANVVDNPAFCQFITPSIVDRGKLTVAISTSGAAPVFARSIRAKLETLLPPSIAPLFDFVANKRTEVQQRVSDGKGRRLFWERFFQLNQDRFDSQTTTHYENAFNDFFTDGEILLLDESARADLLPIAAMPLLQKIDTVYCDGDIEPAFLELIRRDASRQGIALKSDISKAYEKGERMLIIGSNQLINELVAHFPMAKHLRPGNI